MRHPDVGVTPEVGARLMVTMEMQVVGVVEKGDSGVVDLSQTDTMVGCTAIKIMEVAWVIEDEEDGEPMDPPPGDPRMN